MWLLHRGSPAGLPTFFGDRVSCKNPTLHNDLLDSNIEKAAGQFLNTLRVSGNARAVLLVLEECGCSKQIANVPDGLAAAMLMEAAAFKTPYDLVQ